ncbi:MAG: hypothetical protein WCO07_01490 [bacterium]
MSKIKDDLENKKEFANKETEAYEKGYYFDSARHIHRLDGKNLNGITTILSVIAKPALIQWSANMACDYISQNIVSCFDDFMVVSPANKHFDMEKFDNLLKEARNAHRKKKEKAGDIGTEVHQAVEDYIKSGIVVAPDGLNKELVQKSLNNFIEFATENKVKFLESERNLYSRKYWIGGIVDFVCEIDGEVWIGDVKTASGIYPENFLQMAGYQIMLEEMGLYKNIKGHIVVNLRKDGKMEVKKNCEVDIHREAFLSALTLYRCLNDAK